MLKHILSWMLLAFGASLGGAAVALLLQSKTAVAIETPSLEEQVPQRIHDTDLNVTCWVLGKAMSCLPNAQLLWLKPAKVPAPTKVPKPPKAQYLTQNQ